jgi:putative transposase
MNAYQRFMQEGFGQGRLPELTGSGLRKSKGSWSQVLSARRSSHKEEYDERILGSGDFVNSILKEAEERTKRQLKLRRSGKTLADIVEEECKKERISLNELQGGGRRRKITSLRTTIAKRGLDEMGLSFAEIARHVGVTTSAIRKAVLRLEA